MKKYILLPLIFFIGFINITHAKRFVGVITVLEAPIQLKPRLNAKVIQYARKGDRIYIHPKYFNQGQLSKLIVDPKFKGEFEEERDDRLLAYFETMDRNGQIGYILKKQVKLIYNDEREIREPIQAYKKDPTDYRLEEPLPDQYPFSKLESYRSAISATWGPSANHTNYTYSSNITSQELQPSFGVNIYYVKRANWDKESRFFFGGVFQFFNSKSEQGLATQAVTSEQQSVLGLGPTIHYDLWRSKDYSLTSTASLMFNYTRKSITQELADFSAEEQRTFTGTSFMPRLSTYLTVKDITKNIDIITGIDAQAFIPHELTTQSASDELWPTSSIDMSFNAYWNVFIGIQGRY